MKGSTARNLFLKIIESEIGSGRQLQPSTLSGAQKQCEFGKSLKARDISYESNILWKATSLKRKKKIIN